MAEGRIGGHTIGTRAALAAMPRFLPTHPKGYTSIYYPLGDALKKFSQEMRKGGLFYAVNRLRQMNLLRLGRLVGEDSNGNKYYENTNVPYGARVPPNAEYGSVRTAECASAAADTQT